MNTLINPDGSKVNYTKEDYDLQKQENLNVPEEPVVPSKPIGGSFIDPSSGSKKTMLKRINPNVSGKPFAGYNPDDLDYDYDLYGPLGNWNEIQQRRHLLQSNFNKGLNAIAGGLIKGIGTALQDLGYIMDPGSSLKTLGIMNESFFTLSDATEALSDMIHAGIDNGMPTYEDPSNVDELTSWTTVSTVLDNILGFFIPGLGVSRAGSLAAKGVTKMGKLGKWFAKARNLTKLEKLSVNMMKAEDGLSFFMRSNPKFANIANVVGPAVMQTYGEAVWEAKDAHDQFIQKQSASLFENGKNVRDIKNLANDIAQQTFTFNMGKFVLDLGMFNTLATKYGAGIVKKPSVFNKIAAMAVEMPLEGVEESMQDSWKIDAEYTALKAYENINNNSAIIKDLREKGDYSPDKYSSNYLKRMSQLLSLNSSVNAFLIGAVSGFGQKGLAVGARKVLTGKGPIDEFREQLQTYEKQQSYMRETDKLFQSKEAFQKKVEQVALQNDLDKLSDKLGGDARLQELNKRAFYGQEILNHLAKGTYTYLKKIAEQNKDTDGHMSDMYKYIQEMEPFMKSSQGFYNQDKYVEEAFAQKQRKDLRDIFQQKLSEVSTGEQTKLTALQVKDLSESIETLDVMIAQGQETLEEMASKETQKDLHKEQLKEKEFAKVLNDITATKTVKELEDLKEKFPGVESSLAYKLQYKSLKEETPTDPKKKKKKGAKSSDKSGKGNPVVSKLPKEAFVGAVNDYARNTLSDKFEDNEIEMMADEAYNTYLHQAQDLSDEDNTVERHSELSKSISKGVVDDYIVNNRSDIQEDIEESGQEIDRGIRKNKAATERNYEGKLPEEIIEDITESAEKIQSLQDQIKPLEFSDNPEDQTKLDQARIDADKIATEHSSTNKGVIEDLQHAIAAVDSNGMEFAEAFPKFADFVKYISKIAGDKFANRHYETLKSIYRTLGNNAGISMSFSEIMGYDNDVLVPEDMPSENKNIAIDHLNKTNPIFEGEFNDVVDEANADPLGAKIFNRDPTSSVAHLSLSYHQEKSVETGEVVIADDTNPIKSLSPVLDPNKYNGGEELAFEVDTEYDGYVRVRIDEPYMLFSEIRNALFDKKGKIRSSNDPVFQRFVEDHKLSETSVPEDFIPVKILGQNDEVIGYMHQPNWMYNLAIKDQDVKNAQRDLMREKRMAIFNAYKADKKARVKGKVRKKVIVKNEEGRYKGFVLNKGKKKELTHKAMPDKNLTMGYVGNGGMLKGKLDPSQIFNYEEASSYPKGVVLIFVPIGKNINGDMLYHAEALNSVNLTEDLKNTAKGLVRAYYDKGKSKESKALIAHYKTRHGIDITNLKGLHRALAPFFYVYKEKGELDLDFKFQRVKGKSSPAIFSISEERNEITFGFSSKFIISDQQDSEDAIEQFERLVDDNKFFFNVNGSLLNSDKKVKVSFVDADGNIVAAQPEMTYNDFVKQNTATTLFGEPLGDGNFTYTLQNIVEYDVDSKVPTGKGIAESEEEVVLRKELDNVNKSKLTFSFIKSGKQATSKTKIGQIKKAISTHAGPVSTLIQKLEALGVKVNNTVVLESYLKLKESDLKSSLISLSDLVEPVKKETKKDKTKVKQPGIFSSLELLQELGLPTTIEINEETRSVLDIKTQEEVGVFAEALDGDIDLAKSLVPLFSPFNPDAVKKAVAKSKYYKKSNPVSNSSFYSELTSAEKEVVDEAFELDNVSSDMIEEYINKAGKAMAMNYMKSLIEKFKNTGIKLNAMISNNKCK